MNGLPVVDVAHLRGKAPFLAGGSAPAFQAMSGDFSSWSPLATDKILGNSPMPPPTMLPGVMTNLHAPVTTSPTPGFSLPMPCIAAGVQAGVQPAMVPPAPPPPAPPPPAPPPPAMLNSRAPYPWRLDRGPPPPPPPIQPPGQSSSSTVAEAETSSPIMMTAASTGWLSSPASGPASGSTGVLASVTGPANGPCSPLAPGQVADRCSSQPPGGEANQPTATSGFGLRETSTADVATWQRNAAPELPATGMSARAPQVSTTVPSDPWADSVACGLDKWQCLDGWSAPATVLDGRGAGSTSAEHATVASSTGTQSGSSATATSSSSSAVVSSASSRPDAALRSAPAAPSISADKIPKWMKQLAAPTLKMELEIRGLSTEGKRFSLLQRLAASLDKAEQKVDPDAAAPPVPAAAAFPAAGKALPADTDATPWWESWDARNSAAEPSQPSVGSGGRLAPVSNGCGGSDAPPQDSRSRERSRSRENSVRVATATPGPLLPASPTTLETCATSDPYLTAESADDSMEILPEGAEDEHKQPRSAEPAPPERLSLTEAVCPPEVRRSILRWWRQLRNGQSRSEELRQLRARRDQEYAERSKGLEQQVQERRQTVEDWANSRLEVLLQQHREEAENARNRVHDLNRAFESRQASILAEAGLSTSQVNGPLPEHILANFSEVKKSLMAEVPKIIAQRDRSCAAIKEKVSRIRSRQQAELENLEQRPAALKQGIEAAFQKRVAEIEAKYDDGCMSGVPAELLHNIAREVFAARLDLKAMVEGLQGLSDPPAELVRAVKGVARAVHGVSAARTSHGRPEGTAAAAPLVRVKT